MQRPKHIRIKRKTEAYIKTKAYKIEIEAYKIQFEGLKYQDLNLFI